MAVKITGKATGEIDVKRFYMPGVKLESDCPECKTKNKQDMGDDYVSYPSFNTEFGFGFYCHECNHEWEEDVIIEVKLKAVKSEKGKNE